MMRPENAYFVYSISAQKERMDMKEEKHIPCEREARKTADCVVELLLGIAACFAE